MAGYYHEPDARDWADVFIAWVERTIAELKSYRVAQIVPVFNDPGLPGEIIKTGMELADFVLFYDKLAATLPLAQRARDLAGTDLKASAKLWRQIFGDKFPFPDDDVQKQAAPSVLTRPDIRQAPTFG